MFITERFISFFAPHYCIICSNEGAVVCAWCLSDIAPPVPARCYRCKTVTKDSSVCQGCRRTSRLKYVWVRSMYENDVKRLVHDFKFERKQAAAQPIVELMSEALPYLPPDTIVTHVPTATKRVRMRGYDQAELLAKALAGKAGLTHRTLLRRLTQTRQVGAKRTERQMQMQDAFCVVGGRSLQNTSVLIVDDLVTTGATIESVAKCLRSAGVRTVNAAVFAQK